MAYNWSDDDAGYGPDAKAYKTAKKRRDSTTATVSQLAALLPLPKGTNKGKLKTNHILRLAVSFIRMKHLVQNNIMPQHNVVSRSGSRTTDDGIASPHQSPPPSKKKKTDHLELLQLPSEDVLNALDGFLLVVGCQDDDLEILYVSESVFTHLGLYMIDLVGQSLFTLVLEQDRLDVTESLALDSEDIYRQRSFFCQVRSAKGKRPNGRTKSPGQKLVHISGQMCQYQLETTPRRSVAFVGIVRVVKPVSTVEPRFSSCLLTCRKTIDMRVIEVNSLPLEQPVNCRDFWYPEDLPWILESYDKLVKLGQVVWMCHRILYYGEWIWVQAQSSVVKKKYIMTTVSLISEDVAKRALVVRGSLKEKSGSAPLKPHQPAVASTKFLSERSSPCYLPNDPPSRSEMSPPHASGTTYMAACSHGSPPQGIQSQITAYSRSSKSPTSHACCHDNCGSPPQDSHFCRSEGSPTTVTGSNHGSPPRSVQSTATPQVHCSSSGPTYEGCGHGISPYSPWIRSATSPTSAISQNQPRSPDCSGNTNGLSALSISSLLPVFSPGEVESLICDVYPGISTSGAESQILDGGFVKIGELLDAPSPEYPVTTFTDHTVAVRSSEAKQSLYPSVTSPTRQLPVADCMVSPPKLMDFTQFTSQATECLDIPGFDLSYVDLLPEVQDIKLMQYQSLATRNEATSFTHQTETNVQLPIISSDPIYLPPFHSIARGPPPAPVWTLRVPDDHTETMSLKEAQVTVQGHSQVPPLTWDWAVGIDFNQGNNTIGSGPGTYPLQPNQYSGNSNC